MVLVELLGALSVAVGAYALARPMSIRTYPTADEWKDDPTARNGSNGPTRR